MGGDQDPYQDADRGVDAEDDHVDDDSHLLDAAGDHVSPHAEHDGHGVDGDGEQEFPDPGVRLLQPDGHPLEQTVDGERHHHQETSQ